MNNRKNVLQFLLETACPSTDPISRPPTGVNLVFWTPGGGLNFISLLGHFSSLIYTFSIEISTVSEINEDLHDDVVISFR